MPCTHATVLVHRIRADWGCAMSKYSYTIYKVGHAENATRNTNHKRKRYDVGKAQNTEHRIT